MARRLQAVFDVKAVLTAKVALHVGNRDDLLVQDAPVAVDGRGDPYLPGTSLAGPMRAWWREAFGENPEEKETIWGRIEETETQRKKRLGGGSGKEELGGFASLLFVDDAPAQLDGGGPEVRDGVRIASFTGAAADNIKFDRQVLPAGTTFGLRLRLEVPAPETCKDLDLPTLTADGVAEQLAALLAALEAGDIRFGAGKTRGLGRLEASRFEIVRHDVNTPIGVLKRLKGESPRIDWSTLRNPARSVGGGRVVLHVHWTAETPVLNKAGLEGLTIDALPLVSGRPGGKLAPVLTGSSVKGVLRAQAERICRTMARAYLEPGQNGKRDDCAMRLTNTLFGAPGQAKTKDAPSKLGLGALGVEDCFIGPDLSQDEWSRIRNATSQDADAAVAAAQTAVTGTALKGRVSQHVAIDRWTGAAAENLLFNRLEPPPPGERIFRLTLDTARLVSDGTDEVAATVPKAAVALLLFVLRDMARARIPVGFGSNRGLGAIRLTNVVVERAGSDAKKFGFVAEAEFDREQLETPDRESALFKSADDAWRAFWREAPRAVGGSQ